MKYGKDVLLCVLAMVAMETAALFYIIPVYAQMMVMTIAIIYIGSVKSETNKDDEDSEQEQMEGSDVYMFPVIASCALFTLYLVYKFFEKDTVNMVVRLYFFAVGCFLIANQLKDLLLGLDLRIMANFEEVRLVQFVAPNIPYLYEAKKDENGKPISETIKITLLDLVTYVVGLAFGLWWLTQNHWAANNLFGVIFSIQGVEKLYLGTFYNGAVLLTGLFFYDIFWVFGTEVMVTVAKSFDAPIKLLFPRGPDERPSLLGLGDIVIPGIFCAMMLRYDAQRIRALKAAKGKQPVSEVYVYFRTVMVAYFLSLSTTVAVMFFFGAAQPALLYLSPGCLGSVMLMAKYRGEFPALWSFDETPEKTEEQLKAEAEQPWWHWLLK